MGAIGNSDVLEVLARVEQAPLCAHEMDNEKSGATKKVLVDEQLRFDRTKDGLSLGMGKGAGGKSGKERGNTGKETGERRGNSRALPHRRRAHLSIPHP